MRLPWRSARERTHQSKSARTREREKETGRLAKRFFAIVWAAMFVVAVIFWLRSEIAFDEVPELLHEGLRDSG